MAQPQDPLSFAHGPASRNRLMLAPLTNLQSNPDGSCSDDEHRFLAMRAEGGFGIVSTCAAHVAPVGRGFPGQLGAFSDDLLPGLRALAADLRAAGAVSLVQLHHAGRRAAADLIEGPPVCPVDDPETGARALSTSEVEDLVDCFATAATRCQRAGFDGIELHGAHDYLLCEFLSAELNVRTDRYGGDAEGRARLLFEIIEEVRRRCGDDLLLAVRLSPERFGVRTRDILDVYDRIVAEGLVDLVDLSLWDAFKAPAEEGLGESLLGCFAERPRGQVRLAAAGHLYSGADVARVLEVGADVAALGRFGITNHDAPRLIASDSEAAMRALPVPRDVLAAEGIGPAFLEYLSSWAGFVGD
jgi:2,4-dienoyl-CoA reductase-like NADH-dependent reductase (Old Yellow Enzyme family)